MEDVLAAQEHRFLVSTGQANLSSNDRPARRTQVTSSMDQTQNILSSHIEQSHFSIPSGYGSRYALAECGQTQGPEFATQHQQHPQPDSPPRSSSYWPNVVANFHEGTCGSGEWPQFVDPCNMVWSLHRNGPETTTTTTESHQAVSDYGFNAHGRTSTISVQDQSLPDISIEGWDPLRCPSPPAGQHDEDKLENTEVASEDKDVQCGSKYNDK